MKAGLQLYSVRDLAEKDFEATLKLVSELGYESVEPAGFFGKTAEEVKELLQKYQLRLSGTHSSFGELVDHFSETLQYHKTIQNPNYIVPGYDLSSQEKIDGFIKKAEPLRQKLADEGIRLSYHNHASEFYANPDGSVPYEQLLYRTDIGLELDTFWAFIGMKNPVALMDRIHDRLSFIHLKDGLADGTGKTLGQGEAPLDDIIRTAEKYGIYCVVESETLSPDGPTEIAACAEYLKGKPAMLK